MNFKTYAINGFGGSLSFADIIPIFNLFEAYSTAQKVDERYDKIPLLHAEDSSARACYVQQVWINNQPYKEYYNHTVSEYIFHKHIGKLSYSPNNINEALDVSKKIFAKVQWTQKDTHGHLIKITTNSFITQNTQFELVVMKPEIKLNSFRHIDRVVQVFRAFSDLDIRNKDGFLLALKFLYGEEYGEKYQFFKSVVKEIEYDYVNDILIIHANYQHYYDYLYYIAHVVARFFYINSPQVIEIKVMVKTLS